MFIDKILVQRMKVKPTRVDIRSSKMFAVSNFRVIILLYCCIACCLGYTAYYFLDYTEVALQESSCRSFR